VLAGFQVLQNDGHCRGPLMSLTQELSGSAFSKVSL
jgi:hypothetical protein